MIKFWLIFCLFNFYCYNSVSSSMSIKGVSDKYIHENLGHLDKVLGHLLQDHESSMGWHNENSNHYNKASKIYTLSELLNAQKAKSYVFNDDDEVVGYKPNVYYKSVHDNSTYDTNDKNKDTIKYYVVDPQDFKVKTNDNDHSNNYVNNILSLLLNNQASINNKHVDHYAHDNYAGHVYNTFAVKNKDHSNIYDNMKDYLNQDLQEVRFDPLHTNSDKRKDELLQLLYNDANEKKSDNTIGDKKRRGKINHMITFRNKPKSMRQQQRFDTVENLKTYYKYPSKFHTISAQDSNPVINLLSDLQGGNSEFKDLTKKDYGVNFKEIATTLDMKLREQLELAHSLADRCMSLFIRNCVRATSAAVLSACDKHECPYTLKHIIVLKADAFCKEAFECNTINKCGDNDGKGDQLSRISTDELDYTRLGVDNNAKYRKADKKFVEHIQSMMPEHLTMNNLEVIKRGFTRACLNDVKNSCYKACRNTFDHACHLENCSEKIRLYYRYDCVSHCDRQALVSRHKTRRYSEGSDLSTVEEK